VVYVPLTEAGAEAGLAAVLASGDSQSFRVA
jgi:hypothetical protein